MTPPFPPAAFLHLAQQLVAQVEPSSPEMREARVRTALGRTYYALYLLVRAEIMRRHGIPLRRLQHGVVYTRLQSSVASEEVRRVGRMLEWLYALRQKADYEPAADPAWRGRLEDPVGAGELAVSALAIAAKLPKLDFSAVAPLF